MDNFHKTLLDDLWSKYEEKGISHPLQTTELVTQLYSMFFNIRSVHSGTPAGKRLTYDGYMILREVYKEYEILLANDTKYSFRDYTKIDEQSKMPYYLSLQRNGDRKLIVFDEDFAALLLMSDGNISCYF